MSEELKVTSANEYREMTTKLVRVPSGAVFRVRKKATGKIIADMMNLMRTVDIGEIDEAEFMLENLDRIIPMAIIPMIVEPELEADELDNEDALFVLASLNEEIPETGAEAERFRQE